MATIARPNIELTAQDKTARAFNSLRDRMQRLTGNTRALIGTLAGLAGAAGFGALVKGSLDAADQLQKLSIRLGASTEALSEYKHVAELSGVSFDTLTMGWQRMTRRISEAAAGFGEARGALQELGLSAQALNNLAPEQQFEVLADALAGVQSEADRVRLAMKLFDSEGVALIQTMTDGAAGIRNMRDEARDLGLTLTQDAADGAAEANDALARLKAATSGAARVFLVELAPYVELAATAIRERLPGAIRTAIGWFRKLTNIFNQIRGTIAGWIADAIDANRGLRGPLGEVVIVLRDLADEWLNGVAPAADEAADSTLTYTRNLEGALVPTIEITDAANDAADAVNEAAEAFRGYGTVIDKVGGSMSDMQLKTANERLREIATTVDKGTDSIFDMDEAMKQVQNNIQSGFSDLFVDLFSGKGVDSFKDFAKRVLEIFKRLLADMAAAWLASRIFDLPSNFDFGGLGKIFSGGNGGNGGGFLGAIGEKIGGLFGGGNGGGGIMGKIGGGLAKLFGGGASTAAGNIGFKGPAAFATPASTGAGAGAGAGAMAGGAAVVAAIAAYGFGQIARNRRRKQEANQQFFGNVGTGTFEQLNPSAAFRGADDEAGEFFVTLNEGWQSTIKALGEANLLIEHQGALYDERGNELWRIKGNVDGVKEALKNATMTGFEFGGSLHMAIEKGNNLRVSIQGDADQIKQALHAATAAGIGGFHSLQVTGTGVSATLTGDMQRWNDFLQAAVNASIQEAASSMGKLANEAGHATNKFLELARAAAKVAAGGGVSVRAPGFAEGGSFIVGGRSGRDANLVPLRLTKGERVDITPAHEVGKGEGGGVSAGEFRRMRRTLDVYAAKVDKLLNQNARLMARLAS